jgi:hypothetical protein
MVIMSKLSEQEWLELVRKASEQYTLSLTDEEAKYNSARDFVRWLYEQWGYEYRG